MTLRILGYSLSLFALGALFFATIPSNVSTATIQDDRAADRQAIRAHSTASFRLSSGKTPQRCVPLMHRTGLAIWRVRAK